MPDPWPFAPICVRGLVFVAAFIVPLYLMCQFELNYMVHKRRSANFMCFTFDVGAAALCSRWVLVLAARRFPPPCSRTMDSQQH